MKVINHFKENGPTILKVIEELLKNYIENQ